MAPTKPAESDGIITRHLQVHPGLEGFDEDLDPLISLFEELQLCSGDIANPGLDFLTFASGAHYLGVLTEYEIHPPPKEDEKSNKEQDSPFDYAAATPSRPTYQSPYRHLSSKKQHNVDCNRYTVLDDSTHEDKERTFSKGRWLKGIKKFIPTTSSCDDEAGHTSDATKVEPRQDSSWSEKQAWSRVNEDFRKRNSDKSFMDQDIYTYEGVGEADVNDVVTSSSGPREAPTIAQDDVLDISRYVDELDSEIHEEQYRSVVPGELWTNDERNAESGTGSSRTQQAETTALNPLRSVTNWGTPQEYQGNHRDTLYARRSKANKQPVIGLVYLANTGGAVDYLHSGELNLGIIVDSRYRRKGYALQALQIVLESAFEDKHCNRVQAIVVDGPFKHAALNVFMKSGFGHEGTRRRAFRSPYHMEFRDVTYLGLLATDWVLRNTPLSGGFSSASSTSGALPANRFSVAPTSLWEEMFARHQREREELLRWEESNDSAGNRRLKRNASNETIKDAFRYHTERQMGDTTDAESAYASGKSRASSVSGAGYHTSASSSPFGRGSSPAKKPKIDRGKGAAHRTGISASSSSAWSQVGKPEPKQITIDDYVEDSDMDDGAPNINIPTWIANTNASLHNTPISTSHASGGGPMANFRSRSAEASSESGFSELSAPGDDSVSDTGSEASFSSLPSQASLSSGAESNWDMVDGIEYVSDLESQSGRG